MELVFKKDDRRVENMKTLTTAVIIMMITSSHAYAYISGIAIQTEKSSNIQVYINGKLYNKNPEKFVRIKSQPGLFHVEVKVLNPFDKTWYVVRKDIRVEKGYEFYYKMVFAKNKSPQIQQVKRYPVYTKYFLNPALYNKHPIT
jgi:hypothetical protein